MNTNDDLYQHWLEQRRQERVGRELTDRVMAAVAQSDVAEPVPRLVNLVLWVDRSGLRRLAACVVALLLGSGPLLYLAYISQLFVH